MRRIVAAAIVSALLPVAGCSSPARGPAQPIALEQVAPVFGFDVAAVRGTVLRFLDAYASAPNDGGRALSRLVAGPKLTAWTRWLGVQNREFQGTIRGTVDLGSVRFLGILPVRGGVGAQVDLRASVRFGYAPAGDAASERTRTLDGPVTLVRAGTADWRVLDATRDGASMDGAIELFDHVRRRRGGITVRLDSLFAFTPNWQFNVEVLNHSGGSIVLSERAVLLAERPAGSDPIPGIATGSLLRIANGATVSGLCAFPLQRSGRGRVLSLVYRPRTGGPARFDFPLAGLVTGTGAGAPPTTSPAAPGASS